MIKDKETATERFQIVDIATETRSMIKDTASDKLIDELQLLCDIRNNQEIILKNIISQ